MQAKFKSARRSKLWWTRVGIATIVIGAGSLVGGQALLRVIVGRQPDGSVVLPTNQVIKPSGRQLEFNGRPNAIALSPDGQTVAVLNTGTEAGVVLLDLKSGAVKQEFKGAGESASFAGIAYSSDGKKLYASQGYGNLLIANVGADGTLSLDAQVKTPQKDKDDNAYPGGLALSSDGKTLFVTLSRHNALGVFDLEKRVFTKEIPVGNAPHAVALSGEIAYVSNQGGRSAAASDFTLDSSGTKIVADRTSGFATTGTVSVVDLKTAQVTTSIEVGQQPTALLLDGNRLFVTNTNSDSVSIIDTRTNKVSRTIAVRPFAGSLLGSSPNALARVGDRRLLVSLGRNNAVAVYTLGQDALTDARFDGLIPVGFYPGDLIATGTNLIVANNRGVGALADGFSIGPDPATNKTGKSAYAHRGSLSVLTLPDAAQLEADTAAVLRNNNWSALAAGQPVVAPNLKAVPVPLPVRIGEPSVFKHVFYIVKENRTYDQIFGDIKTGNGDPKLQQFGAEATPNQRALAAQYALLDNTYDSGTLSADGHQWVTQAFVVDYIEKSFYDFTRSYPYAGGDALAYPQTGFLWDNALRHGKTVRVYGEYAVENTFSAKAGLWKDYYNDYQIEIGHKTGAKHTVFTARSDVPSLEKLLEKSYPAYDNDIPDVYRAALFIKSFNAYVQSKTLPNLMVLQLPNDHTVGVSENSPTPRAMIADNDLAVGQVVEAISKSPYWKESVIFIIEDDTQNGVDHVDAHRTPAFVISPYTKRGAVVSDYYTQIDFVRGIEQILGLPPMNQMDMSVPGDSLRNVFTNAPDLTPFTAIPNRVPLEEMNPKKATLSGLPRTWAEAMVRQNFRQADRADEALLNRSIWYASKGYSQPYPGDPKVFAPSEVHPYLRSVGRDTPLIDADDRKRYSTPRALELPIWKP